MSKFGSRLAKMRKNYKKSEKEYETMFTNIEPGEYVGKLSSIELKEDNGGKLFISQDYIVTEGDDEGRHVFTNTYLEGKSEEASAKCWAFTRKFLDTMGYEPPENPEDIEGILEEMNGSEVEVNLIVTKQKNDPDRINVSVFLLEEGGGEEDPENPEDNPDDGDGDGGDEDEALRERAVAFAITWDIPDVTEDSTTEEVTDAITAQVDSDGPWDESDLEKEEKELLEDELQIDNAVNKPKPKPTVKKSVKKAVKKSAKKSVKKSAKSRRR